MPWCLSCWPPSTKAVPQQETSALLPSSTQETWKVRLRVCTEGKQEQKGQGLLTEQPPPLPSPGTSTGGRRSLPTALCCSAASATSCLLPFLWQKPHSLCLISVLEVPPLCSWHENPWIGHCLVPLPSPDPDHVSVEPAFKEPQKFCVVLHEPCGGLFWQGCDDVNKGWSAFLVYSVIRITIIVSLTLTYFVKEWIYSWPTVTRGRGQSAEMFSLDCFNKQGYPCLVADWTVCPDTFHTSYLQWRWGSNFYLCKLIIHKNLIATWCT